MGEKVLSIIVPVYNVEAYISKCFDSLVLNDTDLMKRLEVIIVNDGTPDSSAELSSEYVSRYPETFRQIDKENGGHGSAWNVGLKEATGKYVRFLDSDDWFSNLDLLLNDLADCEADIVFNPITKVYLYENRCKVIGTPIPSGTTELPKDWGCDGVNFWFATYKTRILKPLYPLFAERVMFDDYILTWAPLLYGRTCFALEYPVYNYLIGRVGQSMQLTRQRKGARSYLSCIQQYEEVWQKSSNLPIPDELSHYITAAFVKYAYYVFPHLVFLPYKEAQKHMAYLWERYLISFPLKSHMMKRYDVLPFPLFFLLEKIRSTRQRTMEE